MCQKGASTKMHKSLVGTLYTFPLNQRASSSDFKVKTKEILHYKKNKGFTDG